MSDEEPSWASDTPLETTNIIKSVSNPLLPTLTALKDYNQESFGVGAIYGIYQVNDIVCVYSHDQVVRIFNKEKFVRQFVLPKPPSCQLLFNQQIYFFYSDTILQVNIISGIQKTLQNSFGKITFAKKIEDNAVIVYDNNVSILDITQLRSINDFRLRFTPQVCTASKQYFIAANSLDVQIISLQEPFQKLRFTTTSPVTAIETLGNILVIGTKSGMVDIYSLGPINFDTKKIQPVRSYKNLTESIKCIKIQPSGTYIYVCDTNTFRLINIDKLEVCAISYFPAHSKHVIWHENTLLIGKLDGRVIQLKIE